MDIRTKLIFACVAISLTSMLLLAAFFYHTSAEVLRDISARQLESLVSARVEDIQLIRKAWREQVMLIQSRTALREQVARHPEAPSDVKPVVQRIIEDAHRSVTIMRRIAVFDSRGDPVASTGAAEAESRPYVETEGQGLRVAGFALRAADSVDAVVHAPLMLRNERVGHLEAIVETDSLLAITKNYRGLGESGEMYLVAERDSGELTILNRLRQRDSDELVQVPKEQASKVMLAALSGGDTVLEGATDYRGTKVWAATHTLPDLRVGLAVKIDEKEELSRILALRADFVDVTLSVAALSILGGALLGTFLARPIRALHDTVERIRDGEHELRASTTGDDEVSFLSESFNNLMDEQQGKRRR